MASEQKLQLMLNPTSMAPMNHIEIEQMEDAFHFPMMQVHEHGQRPLEI